MSDETNSEKIDFQFPYEPYSIQTEFMTALYKTLDSKKIGIFESPTGTGKSLSLICGSLAWLQQYKKLQLEQIEANLDEAKNSNENSGNRETEDWFASFSKKKEKDDELLLMKRKHEKIKKREEKLNLMKLRVSESVKDSKAKHANFYELFKHKKEVIEKLEENESDDDLLIQHDFHENEDVADDDEQTNNNEEDDTDVKIFYCSRTHSQMSQFIHEIKKTPYKNNVRVVALGSRQTLCINDAVKRLKNLSMINERCLQMHRNKSGKETQVSSEGKVTKRKKVCSTCPFDRQQTIEIVSENLIVEINDIEEAVLIGGKLKGCPYYASRKSVPMAEVVVLPYNTLIHKETRTSCGINLKGSIVIIDEAHNLLDTICNIHTTEVNGVQLNKVHMQLTNYRDRYKSRLAAKTLLYVNQLLAVIQILIKQIIPDTSSQQKESAQENSVEIFTPYDFLSSNDMSNFNLFNLLTFCNQCELARKLNGFTVKYGTQLASGAITKQSSTVGKFLKQLNQNNISEVKLGTTNIAKDHETKEFNESSSFPQVEEFLLKLTKSSKDGRIIINKQDTMEKSSLKYILLNPSGEFHDIVSQARSIIVAGGTMEPISEFRDYLFIRCGAEPDRIMHFSCGHVIAKDHLLPIALSSGPSGRKLEFSYNTRAEPETINELGRLICNLCSVVPDGMVVFFPSYDYENLIYSHWEKSNIIAKISQKKKVFREPKVSGMVDKVLADYSAAITNSIKTNSSVTGAILFSVANGKMSEGINFSDHLGRCVVMVGLPYPNMRSPELKEKMYYLTITNPKIEGKSAGQVYYENLCMKVVNQSIGRAIRHKNDYAAILLVDNRYKNDAVNSALPGWIRTHLRIHPKFGPAFSSLSQFFRSKKPTT